MKNAVYIFAIFGALAACDSEPEVAPAGQEILPPERLDVTYVKTIVAGSDTRDNASDGDVEVSGVVVSNQLAKPSSKTGGVLAAVMFNEGDDVKRGQTLAKIDATELSAGVAQAQAGLTKARRDLARVQALFADSVATLVQRDDALTGVELAQRELDRLQFNRNQNIITAPISGRVMQKLVNAGETVGPGMPVAIIQGTSQDDWRIRVGLTDAQWALTSIGQLAEVRFDAYPGSTFTGTLTERATAADASSGTFAVEFAFAKTEGAPTRPSSLAAGLIANVVMKNDKPPTAQSAAPQLWIPLATLGKVSGKSAEVYLIQKGVAQVRSIQLGQVSGGQVQVASGISRGDTLITTNVAWLRDGDPVRTVRQ